ncbi:MAG: radical SAM protein [Candidatus Omnitrophica bacterium]|nr:radical SAM protein [Candidatus Omnitrophota bacterium]
MKKFHIQWHITSLCNLRCKHCYQENFDASQDICFSDIKKLFNNLSSFLAKNNLKLTIDITGGEPLLHPDFWKILEMLEDSDIVESCGIITNGTLINQDILKKLNCFSKLRTLKVSCEAMEKATFEYFRNFPFERFLHILEIISRFDREKLIMFTLLELNVNQIPLLFDTVEKYGLNGFIVERFFPLGAGKQLEDFTISRKTWKHVTEKLLEMCGIPVNLELVSEHRGFKIIRNKNEWEIFGAVCVRGKNGCAIMHDGWVFPCRRFPLKIANVLNEPFCEIWKKNPLRKISRKNLKGSCGSCRIKRCIGCRALAYVIYGDYLAEDPLCFLSDKAILKPIVKNSI